MKSQLEKIYTANIDYEHALFDLHYNKDAKSFKAVCQEFEYVYFFIQEKKSHFAPTRPYCDDYLYSLQNLEIMIPQFRSRNLKLQNWWGQLKNIELERTLNSKITSTLWSQKNLWSPPEVNIIYNFLEITERIKDDPHSLFLLKSPFLMAGKGNITFTKNEINSPNLKARIENLLKKGPLIFNPKVRIIKEISFNISLDDQGNLISWKVHENFSQQNGQFSGGFIHQDDSQLKPLLENLPLYWRDKITDQLQQSMLNTAKEWGAQGAVGDIGLDYLIYHNDFHPNHEHIKIFLLEVNYRKTMGLMVHSLKRFLEWGGVGSWNVFKKNKINPEEHFHNTQSLFKNILYDPQKRFGVIITSPPENSFFTYYLLARSQDEFKKLHSQCLTLLNIVKC